MKECLRFLVIASEAGQRFFPLSKAVDEVWHELITETRDYQQLCAELPTGRFLHHAGITLSEYAVDRARHWVICTFLREELGMTLAEINQLGRTTKP
ncbi:hypothetical protein [Kribbella flavida]|uniref:hypothetical protein n=1 Tax=Kribbella flavida TaxID=182640 RepID=UPI00019BF1C2|nr:hypothetical protein [Kribbella flavida]